VNINSSRNLFEITQDNSKSNQYAHQLLQPLLNCSQWLLLHLPVLWKLSHHNHSLLPLLRQRHLHDLFLNPKAHLVRQMGYHPDLLPQRDQLLHRHHPIYLALSQQFNRAETIPSRPFREKAPIHIVHYCLLRIHQATCPHL